MKAVENRNLMYMVFKINIFPDFPPSVAKRRAAFANVSAILRGMPGVRCRLVYPVKLLVTHGDVRKTCTDPKKALDYTEKHFSHPP